MHTVKIAVDVVNETQVSIGALLGLDLAGDTITVARAKVYEFIEDKFGGQRKKKELTERQINFAEKMGYDIRGLSRNVGEAMIMDILHGLDVESINTQELAPGVVVYNRHDDSQETLTISSVRNDGIVFFKGGCGRKASARNLVRVSS